MILKLYVNPLKVLSCIEKLNNSNKTAEIEHIKRFLPQVNEIEQYCDDHLIIKDLRWRAGRVKYFMNHHEKIDTVKICDYHIFNNGQLSDGNQRLIASILLGKEMMPCNYQGNSEYFFRELGGKVEYYTKLINKTYFI